MSKRIPPSGSGPSILLGGWGDDVLQAGSGRTVMIGGYGADRLIGGAEDDLLIDGWTSYDSNAAALAAILNERNSAASYATRIAHLSGTPGGLNGTLRLDKAVRKDTSVDILTGNGGVDWLFAKLSSPGKDTLTDLLGGEVVS